MQTPSKDQLKAYNLLVVDDEEGLRETVQFDLEMRGFTVLTAGSGKEALKVAQSNEIHLVVSDIRMPNGDGIYLLKELRKADPEIPVLLFMTGYSDTSESECMQIGAKAVVKKPFDRNFFFQLILKNLGLATSQAA
jgi:two-component system C4-dicarboxylate transport response regulator DctD